jgi:steroid delta-isomerase-like uncharacterized protein
MTLMARRGEWGTDMTDSAAGALSLFGAWEKRDFNGLVQQMADNVVVNDFPRGVVIKGPSDVKDWFAAWAEACPDSTAGVTVAAASDDTAVTQGLYAGTNTGPFGPLAATGRSVSMPFANVIRFDGNGRIVEFSAYYDQLTLLIQLGHAEAPA